MSIFARIKKDHDLQRDLAAKILKTAGDSPERRELWTSFKTEAKSHADAEEQTFYAALIERPKGQKKARHSVSEHKEANDLIEEISKTPMGDATWLQKFKKLKAELEHHMEEEEEEVFPLAEKLLDGQDTEGLRADFETRKAAEK